MPPDPPRGQLIRRVHAVHGLTTSFMLPPPLLAQLEISNAIKDQEEKEAFILEGSQPSHGYGSRKEAGHHFQS